MLRRCSSSAPTSAIGTLCPWAIRSFRLRITRRLSFRLIASVIESSSWRTPTCINSGQSAVGSRQFEIHCPLPTAPCRLIPLLQRPLELLPDVGFEAVADLDVVVALQLDAALEARLHFLDVVLHALERVDHEVLGDDLAVADQADLAAPLDVAVGHHATGDVAQLGHLEDGADLGVAVELLADLRREHAGERLLQVVEDL